MSLLPQRSSQSQLPQPLKVVWYKNWTAHWGWTQGLTGAIGLGFTSMGNVLNNADVKSVLATLHIDPVIMLGLTVIGAITLLSKDHGCSAS